jgi:sortase A
MTTAAGRDTDPPAPRASRRGQPRPPAPPSRGDRLRGALRALANVLIVAGTLMLVDAGLTVTWQEPVTAVIAKIRQDQLGGDLAELRRQGPTALERQALAGLDGERRRIAFLARSLKRRTQHGDAVGRIKIPAIGLNKVVVHGTQTADLRKGPGIYDQTPFPGVPGTTAIAGHRTTYGAPFRHLDAVRPGDRVELRMPYGDFSYRVERTRIVPPTATWVTKAVGYDRLILSACHPLYSAAQRIVVFARLESARPRGTAAG